MARRSTRLSSRNSSTPKRMSLSHDAPARTPKTAPVKLTTLTENDEMPGAFPQSASPPDTMTPSAASKQDLKVPVRFDDATPKQNSPIGPSSTEMHPVQHYQSTAKPLEEARWLGFANMAPQTEPPKQSSRIATLQDTPTRAPKAPSIASSPQYKFTFQREHSLELSPEAKMLMFEKREEAARIRDQMIAAGEAREDVDAAVARKIATAKGKLGRFSQAHLEQFEKMNSISGHASAFRANTSWKAPSSTSVQPGIDHRTHVTSGKSLKRSPSKAQLDEPEAGGKLSRSPSKPAIPAAGGSLPRATSSKNLLSRSPIAKEQSPAKRVKRFQGDDATGTRPSSSGSDAKHPATPSPVKQQPIYPDLPSLASPTQASLARAASVKSTKSSKIPAPALARSPSKPKLLDEKQGSAGPSTPPLARSPSKAAHLSHADNGGMQPPTEGETMSPLLHRSPVKGSLFNKKEGAVAKETGPAPEPLLLRSPLKMSVTKGVGTSEAADSDAQSSSREPLLSRSPMKMSVAKNVDVSGDAKQEKEEEGGRAPLFSRSPMKMSVTKLPEEESSPQKSSLGMMSLDTATSKEPKSSAGVLTSASPTKSANKSLMDRFSFLRSSPVKSILRSPQRLYSDDPAKVAAGTHLATPPKRSATEMNKKLAAAAKTAPTRKHVDFTSSTKARYERAQSEATSTPSKETTPASEDKNEAHLVPKPVFAQYPSLPTENSNNMTPQKRRQTIAPGDFTFRAGPDGIVFGTSPSAPASMAGNKRPSTIRHVSAEPIVPPVSTTKKRKFDFENDKVTHEDGSVPAPSTTSKKRKFEFENEHAEGEAGGVVSDKENADGVDPEGRPAKRVKQSAPSPEKKSKRPTLGVRPKGEVKGTRSTSGGKGGEAIAKEKKPATISQARLAALAQPKRRG